MVRQISRLYTTLWLGRSNPCRVWGTLNIPKEEKESDKEMKTKMTALFLTLVLALGLLGFAVAYWTDELTIEGTVSTGTFGWEWSLEKYYVTHDDKEIIDFDVTLSPATHPDTMTITATDVYPCTDLEILFDLHFWGSVPGNITDISVTGKLNDEELTEVPDWVDIYCKIERITDNIATQTGFKPGDTPSIDVLISKLEGTQWHDCDAIYILLGVHWVEEGMTYHDGTEVPKGVEVPQGATLTFTVTVSGIQYNAP